MDVANNYTKCYSSPKCTKRSLTMSATKEFTWKGKIYVLTEPVKNDRETALKALRRKLHVDLPNVPPQFKNVAQVVSLLLDFIDEKYRSGWQGFQWSNISNLIKDEPCVYAAKDHDNQLKFGMSKCPIRRVNDQKYLCAAARAMSKSQLDNFVPSQLVDKIVELRLPGLCFHPDHDQELRQLIKMQLAEAFLASAYPCITNTVAERLVAIPSHRVMKACAPIVFPKGAIKFFQDIPDGGIKCNLTWRTLPTAVVRMAIDGCDDIKRLLDDRDLDKDGFVKAYLNKELLGPKFGSYKDAITKAPREKQLEKIVQQLKPKLGDSSCTDEDICAIIKQLQGENYSHYVRPEDEELAEAAKALLEQELKTLSPDHLLQIERWSIQVIQKFYPTWLERIIDWGTAIYCLPEDKFALCLVRTHSKQRIFIRGSDFVSCSEEGSIEGKIRSIENFLACLDLLVASGNMAEEDTRTLKERQVSFLMTLDNIKSMDRAHGDTIQPGSSRKIHFREGRRWCFPIGFFPSPPKGGIMSVSNNMGIGYWETIYLHQNLGAEAFEKLMRRLGVLKNQGIPPTEKDFVCPGRPAVGDRIQAKPCPFPDPRRAITMAAATQSKNNPTYGLYICMHCRRGMATVELAGLNLMIDEGAVDPNLHTRKAELEEHKANHAKRERERRIDAIQQHGVVAVRQKEIVKHQKFQDKMAQKKLDDPEYRAALGRKRKAQEDLSRKTKKPSGERRQIRVDRRKDPQCFKYPQCVMDDLEKHLLTWIQEKGNIGKQALNILFSPVLEKHKDILGQDAFGYTKGGKVMYLNDEFDMIVNKYMTRVANTWVVKVLPDNLVKQAKRVASAALVAEKGVKGRDQTKVALDHVMGVCAGTKAPFCSETCWANKRVVQSERTETEISNPSFEPQGDLKPAAIDVIDAIEATMPALVAPEPNQVIQKKKPFLIPEPGVDGASPNSLQGQTIVLTGTFPEFGGGTGLKVGKDKVETMCQSFGARVTSSVSGKTTLLLVGEKPGASKVKTAKEHNIPIADIHKICNMLMGPIDLEEVPPATTAPAGAKPSVRDEAKKVTKEKASALADIKENSNPSAVKKNPTDTATKDYAKMTCELLRGILKDRGLKVSGNKAILIGRLEQQQQQQPVQVQSSRNLGR